MKESVFHRELLVDIRRLPKSVAFKIPDAIRSRGARFIPEKPYDIHATVDGVSYGIECKMHKKPLAPWRLDTVKEHQIKALEDLEAAGGVGYVLVNFRIRSKRTIPQFTNLVMAMRPELFRRRHFDIALADLELLPGIYSRKKAQWQIDELFDKNLNVAKL